MVCSLYWEHADPICTAFTTRSPSAVFAQRDAPDLTPCSAHPASTFWLYGLLISLVCCSGT